MGHRRAREIVDLDGNEVGSGPGDEPLHLFHGRIVGDGGAGEQALALEKVDQPLAFVGAVLPAALGAFGVDDAVREAVLDILSHPPSGEGRKVVRVDHGKGGPGIVTWRLEGVIALLEIEDAITEDIRSPRACR